MPWLALTGYALYLALAFGLRSILHYRRTGSTGFVGISGRPGSVEWLAGMLFAAALVGGAIAPLAQLAGWIEGWTRPENVLVHALGAVVFTAGLAGTLHAQFAMGASWRIGVDASAKTELVAEGPFRHVRNPIFSWMSVVSTGLTLLSPNALAVGAFAALLVALEIHVRAVEEPYLERVHGEAYRRYAEATGRFVPGVGKRRPLAPRGGGPVAEGGR